MLHEIICVCLFLKHLASPALGWIPPNQKLTSETQGISMLIHLLFYEPVYNQSYSDTFPSSASEEEHGWWVGVAIHDGNILTYKVLTKTTKRPSLSYSTPTKPKSRNHRDSTTEIEMESNNTGDKIFIFSHSNSQMLDDDSCD
jgi:hypothetical protein